MVIGLVYHCNKSGGVPHVVTSVFSSMHVPGGFYIPHQMAYLCLPSCVQIGQ